MGFDATYPLLTRQPFEPALFGTPTLKTRHLTLVNSTHLRVLAVPTDGFNAAESF